MKTSRKLYLGLVALFGQVAMAHDGVVKINNNECSGVSYQFGIWNESSRIGQRSSNRSSQPLTTCNDGITEDNCGLGFSTISYFMFCYRAGLLKQTK